MDSKTFKYERHDSFFYPLIPVKIIRSGQPLEIKALIDSGSVISIFKAEVADYLGLPIDRGERRTSTGISGDITVYFDRHLITFDERNKSIAVKEV